MIVLELGYNLLLSFMFAFLAASFLILYRKAKKPLHLWLSVTFFLFLLDDTFLYISQILFYLAERPPHFLISGGPVERIISFATLFAYLMVVDTETGHQTSRRKQVITLVLCALLIVYSFYGLSDRTTQIVTCLALELWCALIFAQGAWRLHTHPELSDEPQYIAVWKWSFVALSLLSLLAGLEFTVAALYPQHSVQLILQLPTRRLVFIEVLSILSSVLCACYLNRESTDLFLSSKQPDSAAQRMEKLFPILVMRYGLTRRELDVLADILAGKTGREIGEHLSISPGTVKAHKHNIFQKTDSGNIQELLALISCIEQSEISTSDTAEQIR